MVTPWRTGTRATPATKPVRPLRAPLLSPNMSIGAFTELEVMFTMRPKPRFIMPSTDALMNSMGVSMLASTALIQSSRTQSRKSPGGGPPPLCDPVARAGARPPAGVVDDDIGLRTGGEPLLAAGLGRDVDGDRRHLHA